LHSLKYPVSIISKAFLGFFREMQKLNFYGFYPHSFSPHFDSIFQFQRRGLGRSRIHFGFKFI